MRYSLLVFFLFVLSFSSSAQRKRDSLVIGQTIDSLYLSSVGKVSVYNLSNNTKTLSSDSGYFVIHASVGDSLLVYTGGYDTTATIYRGKVFDGDTLKLWISPKVGKELEGVVVSTYTYKNYQDDSARRYNEFVEEIGLRKKTYTTGNSGAGLGISLDNIFSHKEKAKKRAYERFNLLEEDAYVNFKFNNVLVHRYSGLKGQALNDFVRKYRPSYAWLRENPSHEDMVYYLNRKLNDFFRNQKDSSSTN